MLAVIEGLDGAGKTTQINLLRKYLDKMNVKSFFIHFPRFDDKVFGDLIAAFLRGEFGEAHSVDPRIVALLYAGDRFNAAPEIRSMIEQNVAVILDRYVYSNVAYQCAKLPVGEERNRLREWIFNMEYNYFNIPRPDINIFLDVPFKFTADKLMMQRGGAEREYLNGKVDIHEADLDLQRRVREVYLQQIEFDPDFLKIDCADSLLAMKKPTEIADEIISALQSKKLIEI